MNYTWLFVIPYQLCILHYTGHNSHLYVVCMLFEVAHLYICCFSLLLFALVVYHIIKMFDLFQDYEILQQTNMFTSFLTKSLRKI